jgi:hypothetical protein
MTGKTVTDYADAAEARAAGFSTIEWLRSRPLAWHLERIKREANLYGHAWGLE